MSDDRAPQRIVVIGNTASGKSTLAARLDVRFGLVHLELDSFAHGPAWQLTAPEVFRHALEERTAGRRWVCDSNHRAHRLPPAAPPLVAGTTAGGGWLRSAAPVATAPRVLPFAGAGLA